MTHKQGGRETFLFLKMWILQQQHTCISQFLVKFQAFVLKDVTHIYG